MRAGKGERLPEVSPSDLDSANEIGGGHVESAGKLRDGGKPRIALAGFQPRYRCRMYADSEAEVHLGHASAVPRAFRFPAKRWRSSTGWFIRRQPSNGLLNAAIANAAGPDVASRFRTMPASPLFSTYRTGENRVTSSMLAVFERVGFDILERVLRGAVGDSDLELVRFRNQVADEPGSVPDAQIQASFSLVFEVKTEPNVPDEALRDQLQRHADGLQRAGGHYADQRILLITPDGGPPRAVSQVTGVSAVWVSFAALDQALHTVLGDGDEPVSTESAFLLRELRRLFSAEGLLDVRDTVIVAARKAYPAYGRADAYVCQTGRSFRQGLTHLGFYAEGEIKPDIARILATEDGVLFTAERARELRAEGKDRLAEVVERYLEIEPDRNGERWLVFVLSGARDERTVSLPAPIKNTTRTSEGRPWAWTLGQRYTRLELLRRGPPDTTALQLAEAGGS